MPGAPRDAEVLSLRFDTRIIFHITDLGLPATVEFGRSEVACC